VEGRIGEVILGREEASQRLILSRKQIAVGRSEKDLGGPNIVAFWRMGLFGALLGTDTPSPTGPQDGQKSGWLQC